MLICSHASVCKNEICKHHKPHKDVLNMCYTHKGFHSCIKGSKCEDDFITIITKIVKEEK